MKWRVVTWAGEHVPVEADRVRAGRKGWAYFYQQKNGIDELVALYWRPRQVKGD
jgi:hypothetical protein